MKAFFRFIKRVIILTILLVLVGLFAYGYWQSSQPKPIVLQGQLEARETDVAAKIPGRIADVFVVEGEAIEVGTMLARMDSPEIQAKVQQAEAAQSAAEAVAQKAENGARPQEIEMAEATWRRAQAAAEVTEKSYRRVEHMANEGLISRQKRDEVYAQYKAAQDQERAAKAQYEMAQIGAREEDKAAAAAQVKQVSAVVAEAQIALDESQLKSPVAGVIADIIAKPGEVVPKGIPLVTVVDLSDQWLVLQIREDLLANFAIGNTFTATIPALSTSDRQYEVPFKVFSSAVLPDFATWRATRNNDGFDIRTFEVKARPIKPIVGMRPGMSALLSLPASQ